MARIRNLDFDEANSLEYEDYFGEMEIDDDGVEQRVLTAQIVDEHILEALSWYERRSPSVQDGYSRIYDAYMEMLDDLDLADDDYLAERAESFAKQIEKTTREHSGEYWTSADRASLIARVESNIVNNYRDFAIASGLVGAGLAIARSQGRKKKHKTWVTMGDDRVRPSHVDMEDVTVPINGFFYVGLSKSKMRFPMDTAFDPDPNEIINCRCTCYYS